MLSRREFLKKSALAAGTLSGVTGIITIAENLMAAESSSGTVSTGLAFIDTADISRTMESIDRFGDPGEGRSISAKLFREGMELSEFINSYCDATARLYNVKPAAGNLYDGAAISSYADARLELLQSLAVMMNNIIFSYHLKHARVSLPYGSEETIRPDVADIFNAAELLNRKWNISGFSFITGDNSNPQKITLTAPGAYKRDYTEWNLDIFRMKEILNSYWDSYSVERFIRDKESFLRQVSYARYLCKGIYSRSSILTAYEKYYSAVPGKNEKISGSKITSGARRFIDKTLCSLLFIELAAARLRLIVHRSRSGIFSNDDREMFSIECSELIAVVNEISGKPLFDGKKIFSGEFTSKPAVLESDGMKGKVSIPLLNAYTLGLEDSPGKDISSHLTQGNLDKTIAVIDKAIERIRILKEQIAGGVVR